MSANEVKYLKFAAYLNTYCPYCRKSFNVKTMDEDYLDFRGTYQGKTAELKLSPYLDVFDKWSSIPLEEGIVLDDFLRGFCGHSLVVKEPKCGECGSPVAELIISAYSRLISFFICLKKGCEWHGLSKADEFHVRLKIPRQEMPEQDSMIRRQNFDEVPLGLTSDQAQLEAGRCLQCRKPGCTDGCPVNVDIPAFIRLVREDRIIDAAHKIKERNILPAICGRVCPQEDQCEKGCILGKRDRPVAIGNLERYIADYERMLGHISIPHKIKRINKKVAVIGSGPGGLTCAADLTLLGYQVTIFEAFHKPGGVLGYGIPQFRLPKEIMAKEINYLKELGCQIKMNSVIGKLYTVDELLREFQAVYIGVGAGSPKFLDIEGEDLNNVVSANEYLTRINLMKAYKFPDSDTPLPQGDRIAVIGGGNVAMDSARSALRTGAKEVTIIYRRTRNEIPARKEEVRHAEDEGIKFMFLTNPVRFLGDKRNWLRSIDCVKMELSEPDGSGRRKPKIIDGSNFSYDCDVAVVAVGTSVNPLIFDTTPDIKRDKDGYIIVDPNTMETSKRSVYAGGDIVTGSATVIQAMGAGRKAAKAIHERLMSNVSDPQNQLDPDIVLPI